MVLPSLTDALIVIILLIPGFISFTLIRWVGSYGSKLSEFEITIASFICSMFVLFLYTWATGFTDIDRIRDNFFIPQNYAKLFGLALATGLTIGGILKIRRTNYDRLDSWQRIITNYKNAPWVIVFTTDGNEYKGILTRAGINEVKDLVITHPKQIIRDPSKVITAEVSFKEKILFKEEDIARIVFLS